jgi:hypothetical protein
MLAGMTPRDIAWQEKAFDEILAQTGSSCYAKCRALLATASQSCACLARSRCLARQPGLCLPRDGDYVLWHFSSDLLECGARDAARAGCVVVQRRSHGHYLLVPGWQYAIGQDRLTQATLYSVNVPPYVPPVHLAECLCRHPLNQEASTAFVYAPCAATCDCYHTVELLPGSRSLLVKG